MSMGWTDSFGNDEYHIERIEDRYDFKGLAQPHEGNGDTIVFLRDNPGHACNRLCDCGQGDLRQWLEERT